MCPNFRPTPAPTRRSSLQRCGLKHIGTQLSVFDRQRFARRIRDLLLFYSPCQILVIAIVAESCIPDSVKHIVRDSLQEQEQEGVTSIICVNSHGSHVQSIALVVISEEAEGRGMSPLAQRDRLLDEVEHFAAGFRQRTVTTVTVLQLKRLIKVHAPCPGHWQWRLLCLPVPVSGHGACPPRAVPACFI